MAEENSNKNKEANIDERTVKSKRGNKLNHWMISSVILLALVLALLVLNFKISGMAVKGVGEKDAGQKVVDFFKKYQGLDVRLVSVSQESGLYAVKISAGAGKEGIFYLTKDGAMLGSMTSIALIEKELSTKTNQAQPTEISKSDKPTVELFVMSYCPYGTQAEKALLPVIKSLKGSADISVRFVHYTMHGEKEDEENYRQLCIREEQKDRFTLYLENFLIAGDYKSALAKSDIDQVKLDDCMKNRAKGYYAADSKLSEQYGVSGSPTFVINGVQKEVERNSAGVLKSVCSAFNSEPKECSSQLSAEIPTAGFGITTNGPEHASGSCAG